MCVSVYMCVYQCVYQCVCVTSCGDYSTSSSDCPGVAANSCQLESLQGERKCNEDVCVRVCGELQRLQGRM